MTLIHHWLVDVTGQCVRFLRSLRRNLVHRWCIGTSHPWVFTTFILAVIVVLLLYLQSHQQPPCKILALQQKQNNHDNEQNKHPAAVIVAKKIRPVRANRQAKADSLLRGGTTSASSKNIAKKVSTKIVEETTTTTANRQIQQCADENDFELCAFKRMIAATRKDYKLLSSTWNVCSQVLHKLSNASWYLYGTSLLGYYRHGGSIMPWDDFIDIALYPSGPGLPNAYFAKQFQRLIKKFPGYTSYFVEAQSKIKCFGSWATNSRLIPSRGSWVPKWRWPYVEIQIMRTNWSEAGRMETVQDPYWPEYWYYGTDILPLQPAVFESRPVFVPSNTPKVLDRNYDITWCTTRFYSHKVEQVEPDGDYVSRPCSDLRHFVNFTNAEFDGRGPLTCPEGDAAEDQRVCRFLPVLSQSEKANLIKTTSVCLKIVEQLVDASYFLYAGSLLGLYRHGGRMIPWDDDVDLAVIPHSNDVNVTYYVQQLMERIQKYPGYTVHYMPSQVKVKCFGIWPNNSKEIPRTRSWRAAWRWPYVDIQIMGSNFSVNATNRWKIETIEDLSGFSSYWYPTRMIFPLKRTTFESLSVLVPRDVKTVLSRNYDIETCVAPYYDHMSERSLVQTDVPLIKRPCSELGFMYNFTGISSLSVEDDDKKK